MKRRFFLHFVVLLYAHSTYVTAATTCDQFRTDLQSIQQQVRQNELDRSTSVLNSVQQAGQAVKTTCLDQLSALDMSSFGFTPGASALVTKLASQACQKLSQQLSQQIGQVQQQAMQGINGAIGGINIPGVSSGTLNTALGNGLGAGLQPVTSSSGTSFASQAASYVTNAWDKLKNILTP